MSNTKIAASGNSQAQLTQADIVAINEAAREMRQMYEGPLADGNAAAIEAVREEREATERLVSITQGILDGNDRARAEFESDPRLLEAADSLVHVYYREADGERLPRERARADRIIEILGDLHQVTSLSASGLHEPSANKYTNHIIGITSLVEATRPNAMDVDAIRQAALNAPEGAVDADLRDALTHARLGNYSGFDKLEVLKAAKKLLNRYGTVNSQSVMYSTQIQEAGARIAKLIRYRQGLINDSSPALPNGTSIDKASAGSSSELKNDFKEHLAAFRKALANPDPSGMDEAAEAIERALEAHSGVKFKTHADLVSYMEKVEVRLDVLNALEKLGHSPRTSPIAYDLVKKTLEAPHAERSAVESGGKPASERGKRGPGTSSKGAKPSLRR